MSSQKETPQTVWTIGHSTREQAEFLELLAGASIELVADVRRFAGSRRYPHFGGGALAEALAKEEIEYRHFPALGGRRTSRLSDSPNTAWRVEAFNAYADYMTSQEFKSAFEELLKAARQVRTAIMCAEAVPWRCHRRLIADLFVARGWRVLDIVSPGRTTEHTLPEFAVVIKDGVVYPGNAPSDESGTN